MGSVQTCTPDFNPRSPHGERHEVLATGKMTIKISIHAPRTGSDRVANATVDDRHISIHAPRTGSDDDTAQSGARARHFNPRSPHGERPTWCSSKLCTAEISIHAPRTGSDYQLPRAAVEANHISIHAPRTGSDATNHGSCFPSSNFNPRSPHGERPSPHCARACPAAIFQSTLPARGATRAEIIRRPPNTYFNPRSPHGERPGNGKGQKHIEIFQSTLPARGATRSPECVYSKSSFQSTLPARGATHTVALDIVAIQFQSTLPARGATLYRIAASFLAMISIHAPRTGSDGATAQGGA